MICKRGKWECCERFDEKTIGEEQMQRVFDAVLGNLIKNAKCLNQQAAKSRSSCSELIKNFILTYSRAGRHFMWRERKRFVLIRYPVCLMSLSLSLAVGFTFPWWQSGPLSSASFPTQLPISFEVWHHHLDHDTSFDYCFIFCLTSVGVQVKPRAGLLPWKLQLRALILIFAMTKGATDPHKLHPSFDVFALSNKSLN